MKKILANDGIHPDGKLLLEEAGYQVDTDKIPQEDLEHRLPAYDAIIVRSATKVRESLIRQCPNLKVIARAGVGLDNIDVAFAKSQGIEVINTPAASSQSVAELAFAHIFNLARFAHLSNQEMPTKGTTDFKKLKKAYSKGIQLRGKKLGILGFGRIGQEVARMGLGLGMKILPVDLKRKNVKLDLDLYTNDEVTLSVTVSTVSFSKMLAESDFISVHVPGGNLISKAEIEQMKDGVVLINTARGGVISEDALLEMLDNGKIGGAGIDVFENEPTPKEALLKHPKVSVTPHIGASTLEAQRNIGLELADKILAFYGDDK